jgi:hypothetical protein
VELLSISVENIPDECDFNDLGKWATARDIGYKDHYIDRATGELFCGSELLATDPEGGVHVGRNHYALFKCGENYRNKKGYLDGPDEHNYCFQDWHRAESLNNGAWHYVIVQAEAEIEINGTTQTIRSSGLGGVESDSGEYLAECGEGQLAELRDILIGLGIRPEDIATHDD